MATCSWATWNVGLEDFNPLVVLSGLTQRAAGTEGRWFVHLVVRHAVQRVSDRQGPDPQKMRLPIPGVGTICCKYH